MKKFSLIFLFLLLTISSVPMFAYWWGLSNIENIPTPTDSILSTNVELQVWQKLDGLGEPNLIPMSPYSFVFNFMCHIDKSSNSQDCLTTHPGYIATTSVVRDQIANQVNGTNIKWQITWASYSIWVTRNWTINQILATYHGIQNT